MNGNDILMGGGGSPTLPLGKRAGQPAGEMRGGVVLNDEPTPFPVRDPKTGEAKLYPSGDPIMGVHVDVQTPARDPSIPNDDGVRRIYIEGSTKGDAYASKRKAVIDAVRLIGAAGIERGGELFLTWTHEVDTGTGIPAQNWSARYVRAGNTALMGPGGPGQGHAAPVAAAPAYAPGPPIWAAGGPPPAAPQYGTPPPSAPQYAPQYAPVTGPAQAQAQAPSPAPWMTGAPEPAPAAAPPAQQIEVTAEMLAALQAAQNAGLIPRG